jgi:predicted dehydrogenase
MQVRWGLLGCGDIARKRVARAISDDPHSRLVAACRRDPSRLQDFCSAFGVERAYTCDTNLLADADIDAVYIATPVHLHLPQTLAAAAAGKHVLVEKPMALSVAECDRMIEACQRHGVLLGVAYYRRFYPVVDHIKQAVAAGELGRPLAAGAVTSTALAGPGTDGRWRVILSEGGGGALMDVGSHRLNLFLDLFGDVADVRACCDTLLGSYAAEDCATLLVRFRQGVHVTLQCLFGTAVGTDDFWVLGTAGRLVAGPLNGGRLVIETDQGQQVESHPPAANLHGPLVSDFAAAVLEGRQPRVTGEEGRRTNLVMEWAYCSAAGRQGRAP